MSRVLDILNDEYFNWLCDLACGDRYASGISYRKLFARLHETEFKCLIPNDLNRAEDGVDLRYRFALHRGELSVNTILNVLDGPCSVLEMMIALALRCEEQIMDDPGVGDRTTQWFWGMLWNLGLSTMTDARFDGVTVDKALIRLNYREYEPDGTGGLFTIKNCKYDLRQVEIWHQLLWYLDSVD